MLKYPVPFLVDAIPEDLSPLTVFRKCVIIGAYTLKSLLGCEVYQGFGLTRPPVPDKTGTVKTAIHRPEERNLVGTRHEMMRYGYLHLSPWGGNY